MVLTSELRQTQKKIETLGLNKEEEEEIKEKQKTVFKRGRVKEEGNAEKSAQLNTKGLEGVMRSLLL
ncbi:hypothetical protein YC2023_063268 [Brassica napus]